MMTLAKWAKIVGIVGGAMVAASQAIPSPTWKTVVGIAGGALTATGIVIASDTSAGHPDGDQTTKDQAAPFVSK